MSHHFQDMNRMCVTPNFAGGKLQMKWSRKQRRKKLVNSGVPYIDFYLMSKVNSTIFGFGRCHHLYSDIFPTKRHFVYNGTFIQNFPVNTDQLLRTFYGRNWSIPSSKKSSHGLKRCPYGPRYH